MQRRGERAELLGHVVLEEVAHLVLFLGGVRQRRGLQELGNDRRKRAPEYGSRAQLTARTCRAPFSGWSSNFSPTFF